MMMDPINGSFAFLLFFEPWTHFTLKYMKFHNLNGPFEILMNPLENLMGQKAFYMPIRASLMIYLNSICIYMDPFKNNVHFGLAFIVFSQNGVGPSQYYPRICVGCTVVKRIS